MLTRPVELNLANWRSPPHSRWAFHHVREVIPTETIHCGGQINQLATLAADVTGLDTPGLHGEQWSLQRWLDASNSDALLIAHRGKLVHAWYADAEINSYPHIVFSVSKSITAILAGVLVGQGLLDPHKLLTDYIPELADSGYRDARLQQLLDMQICIDFDEDYLASTGKFVEYRQATGWHPCDLDTIDSNLHDFLCTLAPSNGTHGQVWQYKSPNSDLLGWILERVSGERFASLMSRLLWQPMGAEANAYVTVDRKGAARTAGGICVVPQDLLRFAELVRLRGYANGRQIVPQAWIDDCICGGSRDAWQRGDSVREFPDGRYRNKWYQTGDEDQTMLAIGIHSQWIYINPASEVSIVKLSSQGQPLRPDLDPINLQAFSNINALLSAHA